MKELLEGLGWEEIVSKNQYMYSFVKEGKRLNLYFTTGTVTIQSTDSYGPGKTFRDITTPEELEKIL